MLLDFDKQLESRLPVLGLYIIPAAGQENKGRQQCVCVLQPLARGPDHHLRRTPCSVHEHPEEWPLLTSSWKAKSMRQVSS